MVVIDAGRVCLVVPHDLIDGARVPATGRRRLPCLALIVGIDHPRATARLTVNFTVFVRAEAVAFRADVGVGIGGRSEPRLHQFCVGAPVGRFLGFEPRSFAERRFRGPHCGVSQIGEWRRALPARCRPPEGHSTPATATAELAFGAKPREIGWVMPARFIGQGRGSRPTCR